MALLNRQVLVCYDVAGPELWHERLVLEHVNDEEYIVATPDRDVYCEQLSLLNDDLKGIRVKPSPNVLPGGINPASVYPLPLFNAGEVAALRLEAQRELATERAARGLVAVGAVPFNQAALGANSFVAGTLYWVACERVGTVKYGDNVVGVNAVAVDGAKSVHTTGDGDQIFVECIDGSKHRQFLQRPASWDIRVVGQDFDGLGKPDCSLKEVSRKSEESEVLWTLAGPRTCRWCISYLVVEGLGFEGHHERFRQLCKLEPSSWGVQEHFQLSMIAKHALQVDQINGYNTMFLEVVFRRLQTIEFAYAEKARDSESRAIGGKLSLEEQQTFGGLTRQAGTLMVCPELLDHVKTEVERDASLSIKTCGKQGKNETLQKRQEKRKVKTPPDGGEGWLPGAAPVLEPNAPLHGPFRKPRDIYPLPWMCGVDRPASFECSRKSRRRIEHSQHLVEESNLTIRALNSMYGSAGPQKPSLSLEEQLHGEAAAQWSCLEFIQHSVQQMGKPPTDLDCLGALRALQTASGYEGDQPSGSLASFNIEAISLPDPGWKPIDLAELWGDDGRHQVNEFVSNQLLPPEIARAKLGACGVKKPYSDPLLRQGRVYQSFLNRLHQSSLVDFSLQPGLEQIAFFCVTKKSGKLRLIVDARRSNACFKEPDHVELATGEGLGALEMAAGSKVTIGMADLKDAFYHLSLPVQLRPYFSLPRVRAGSVGIDNIAGVDVAPGTWLTPRLAVVPMGWSWALYLCQSVHECLAEKAGLGEANRIRDRKPPPSSVCCHTQYVDNMIVIGTNSELVTSAYETAVNCLKHAGLQVHEEELGKGGQLLGWEITDHGAFRPTRHRAWKVRLSIRGLLKRGRCSAHLLEKLIGHCSFLSLGRRECFSIFGDVYSFIQTYQRSSHEFPLWKGVRRELMTFDGAIPLIQRDLTSEWSPQVLAVDASEFGLGATQARFSVDEVRRLGQVNERWRFKDPLGRNPRQRILQEQYESVTFGEGLMVVEGDNRTDVVQESGFSNVPFSSVSRDWVTVGLHRWKKKSSLPVYEGRASLFAVKHILRSKQNFGKRHVILSDSLTATCAISRGRSPQFNLRRVCSQIGALALATGSYFCIRWIPSEWNPADNPSRGKWSPSVPVQFFGDGLVSAASTGNPSKVDIQQDTTEGGRKIPGTCRSQFGNPTDSGTTPYPDASARDADRPEWCQSECEEDESKEIESRSGGSAERANHAGGSLSVKAMPFSLFSALGFDQAKDSQQPGEVEVHEDGRQRFNKAPGRDVSRWRRYQFGPVCHSRCTTLCAKPAEQTEQQPAESETVFEGMEQIITTSESASGSLGSCLHAGDGEFQIGEASFWSPHSSHVLPVFAANRMFETESMRPCPTKPEGQGTIPVVVIGPTSSRRRDPLKDHGVRRGVESRPGLSSRSWDGSPQLSMQEGHSSGAENFHTLQRRSQHIPQPSLYITGASGNWSDPSLQVSSWRSFARLPHKTQRSQCSPAKGALEMPCFGSKISEGVQVGPSLRRSTSPSSKVGKQGGCRYQPCSAKPALSSVLRPGPRYQVFLEIFSGCGRLGKTIARDNNWPVLLWDICLGERYDLRSSQNRRLILGWIRAGFILGGHCGTPCNSFSRARDRRPGPPPLRSDTMVMGLAGLASHDQIKVSEGNLFMRFTVQIMMVAASLMLPWTFENPARSRIWLTPPVLRMLRRRCCTFTIFEMCMFGTSWRKPTAIAAMHVSLERRQLFRCLGSKRGCCKRTGMPHTQLCGQTPSGEWKTHAAQKYPFKLCKALASCFYDFLACRRADNFSAILAREP